MVSNRVYTVDLRKPVPTIQLGSMGIGDNNAAALMLNVLDSGSPVSAAGNGVIGYFMRSDGTTVVQNGAVDRNTVGVVIPEAALAVPGRVEAAVRTEINGIKYTLAFAVISAKAVNGDTLIDPGHVVPNIDNLLAQIQRMEAGTAAAENVVNTIDSKYADIKAQISSERTRAIGEEQRIEALFTAPTQEAVNTWLDAHPEATTTVQDGSLTESKMHASFLRKIKDEYVTPEHFGAVGDGVTDDSDAIQAAVRYAIDNHVAFIGSGKVYGIGKEIVLMTQNDGENELYMDWCGSLIVALADMRSMLYLDTKDGGIDPPRHTRFVQNLRLDGKGKANYGIYQQHANKTHFQCLHTLDFKVAHILSVGTALFVNTAYMDQRDMRYPHVTGIEVRMTDNKISNVLMRNMFIGVDLVGSTSDLINVHPYLINQETLHGSVCFRVHTGANHFIGCYADTYETDIEYVDDNRPPETHTSFTLSLTNFTHYTNTDWYNNSTCETQPTIFKFYGRNDSRYLYYQGLELDVGSYYNATGKKTKLSNLTSFQLSSTNWFDFDNRAYVNMAAVEGLPDMHNHMRFLNYEYGRAGFDFAASNTSDVRIDFNHTFEQDPRIVVQPRVEGTTNVNYSNLAVVVVERAKDHAVLRGIMPEATPFTPYVDWLALGV